MIYGNYFKLYFLLVRWIGLENVGEDFDCKMKWWMDFVGCKIKMVYIVNIFMKIM